MKLADEMARDRIRVCPDCGKYKLDPYYDVLNSLIHTNHFQRVSDRVLSDEDENATASMCAHILAKIDRKEIEELVCVPYYLPSGVKAVAFVFVYDENTFVWSIVGSTRTIYEELMELLRPISYARMSLRALRKLFKDVRIHDIGRRPLGAAKACSLVVWTVLGTRIVDIDDQE